MRVRELIKSMRAGGFDSTLRAGQSVSSLILSRSRRHGLGEGQSFIQFFFFSDESSMNVNAHLESGEKKLSVPIELSDELRELLEQLAQEDISHNPWDEERYSPFKGFF